MTSVNVDVLMAFDALQGQYAAALDKQRMQDWLATFSNDESAAYVCTTAENVEAGFKIAWILDDCRARLLDRVTFVTKVWAGTYNEHRTRRVAQRTAWNPLDDGQFAFESSFIATYCSADVRRAEVFATGTYNDVVRFEAGELKFMKRQVIVDGHILNRYLVYPL
ncbi:MAG: hypothetical protein JW395_2619 [Nitrospira sp.]|nr:hypothetical protein [Nitrospira sp.]